MNKKTKQFILCVCALLEALLIYKISISEDLIHVELYSGLAVVVLLLMLRLLYNLTDITYGKQE